MKLSFPEQCHQISAGEELVLYILTEMSTSRGHFTHWLMEGMISLINNYFIVIEIIIFNLLPKSMPRNRTSGSKMIKYAKQKNISMDQIPLWSQQSINPSALTFWFLSKFELTDLGRHTRCHTKIRNEI